MAESSEDAPPRLPVFDGHNDTLLRLYRSGQGAAGFFAEDGGGHIDLRRAHQGGFVGGFFAVFVPSEPNLPASDLAITRDGYAMRMSSPVEETLARMMTSRIAAILFEIAAMSDGAVRVVRSTADLENCLADGSIAAVLHYEGAEAIEPGLDNLDELYAGGLRSLGLVWSRPNCFAHGVPFAFPRSPDTGPGLTDRGRDLVGACNSLGIVLDLSHLNEAGFWGVAQLTDAPLVVSHAGVHEICPVTRNLTDRQLDAIGESDGIVGVPFAAEMLRPDGNLDQDTPMECVVRHIDYVARRIGVDRVAIGSDFDGCTVPAEVGDVAGLPRVMAALSAAGYDDDTLRKIGYENWVRVLGRTWR